MKTRRKASILAFQALYAWDLQSQASGKCVEIAPFLAFDWTSREKLEGLGAEIVDFARIIAGGAAENHEKIDSVIKSKLKNWDFSRLNAADRAILRFGIYLLLFQKDIPPPLVIEEAIKISLEYSGGDSYKFINGILDAVRANI